MTTNADSLSPAKLAMANATHSLDATKQLSAHNASFSLLEGLPIELRLAIYDFCNGCSLLTLRKVCRTTYNDLPDSFVDKFLWFALRSPQPYELRETEEPVEPLEWLLEGSRESFKPASNHVQNIIIHITNSFRFYMSSERNSHPCLLAIDALSQVFPKLRHVVVHDSFYGTDEYETPDFAGKLIQCIPLKLAVTFYVPHKKCVAELDAQMQAYEDGSLTKFEYPSKIDWDNEVARDFLTFARSMEDFIRGMSEDGWQFQGQSNTSAEHYAAVYDSMEARKETQTRLQIGDAKTTRVVALGDVLGRMKDMKADAIKLPKTWYFEGLEL